MGSRMKIATGTLNDEQFKRFYKDLNTLKLKDFCELKFEIINSGGPEGFIRHVTIFTSTRNGEYFLRESIQGGDLHKLGWSNKFRINK